MGRVWIVAAPARLRRSAATGSSFDSPDRQRTRQSGARRKTPSSHTGDFSTSSGPDMPGWPATRDGHKNSDLPHLRNCKISQRCPLDRMVSTLRIRQLSTDVMPLATGPPRWLLRSGAFFMRPRVRRPCPATSGQVCGGTIGWVIASGSTTDAVRVLIDPRRTTRGDGPGSVATMSLRRWVHSSGCDRYLGRP
jgi:hypothetical protein